MFGTVLAAQVMGDSSPAADKLMRSQGVRALPSFHFVRHEPPRTTLQAHLSGTIVRFARTC